MKGTKVILPIVLVVALGLSWFSFITGTLGKHRDYQECLDNAQTSTEQGLYEQAVEFYKEALTYEKSQETYEKIKECYDALYAEEHITYIRDCYIQDMSLATEDFPEVAMFWTAQVELHMEALSYSKAYETVKQAIQRGAKSDRLTELHNSLLYMTKQDYNLYTDFRTALNGYISVCEGSSWLVIDDYGEELTGQYNYVGLINDDGSGLYVNDVDVRLLDYYEVSRARFQISIEEAGYYDASSDLVPVKTNGVWKYMNSAGEFLPGEFDVAGSFYDNKAVVCSKGTWYEIDDTGNTTALSGIEDVKLDLYGCHIQNGIVIAKSGGKYHIYDTGFNMIGDFAADDIDICIDPNYIAYQKSGKWGFVNSKGEIVQEAQYAGAKSFSNGYAAVCNGEGQWGFINDAFDVVIDYQFVDAFYFTAAESCMISNKEGTFQRLYFMFE